MSNRFRSGVLFGEEVKAVLDDAKERGYALPAVNVIGSCSINAVLETARDLNSPVIIQFSNGGASFNAGKGLRWIIKNMRFWVLLLERTTLTHLQKLMEFL